jgi:hypothetical protein
MPLFGLLQSGVKAGDVFGNGFNRDYNLKLFKRIMGYV